MLLGMILPEHLSVMETRPRSSPGKNGISRERVRPKNTPAGFSLVELIVVLALILIIVAVSIPSITQTINNYRLDADRKSTRLNSSHQIISYAVFCLKKKKTHTNID